MSSTSESKEYSPCINYSKTIKCSLTEGIINSLASTYHNEVFKVLSFEISLHEIIDPKTYSINDFNLLSTLNFLAI